MTVGNLDESTAINEILKTIVFFHQTLDEKKEDLSDALENIEDFYNDKEPVDQDDFNLEGDPIKIKVLKPMSRENQKIFNNAIIEISTQVSAMYVVSMDMKQKLHKLGTDRIEANTQVEPAKPEGQSFADKAKQVISSGFGNKKQKEYASLNELDDPFKLSKNQIQEAENYTNIFDKFVELHHFSIEMAEETDISGQKRLLDLEVNFFNSRVQGKILRLIDDANRIQREAERNEAIKVMTEANKQSQRQRNVMGGMQMPPNQ